MAKRYIWFLALAPLLALQIGPASAGNGCRWSNELKEEVCSITHDGGDQPYNYKPKRQKPSAAAIRARDAWKESYARRKRLDSPGYQRTKQSWQENYARRRSLDQAHNSGR